MISDVIVGLVTGGFVSWIFYRIGRDDTEALHRIGLLSSVIMRLKEMTPTSEEKVIDGYGLRDTVHFITCLKELMTGIEWPEGSRILEPIITEMKSLPHIENPTKQQATDRETKKKEWESHLYSKIKELRTNRCR